MMRIDCILTTNNLKLLKDANRLYINHQQHINQATDLYRCVADEYLYEQNESKMSSNVLLKQCTTMLTTKALQYAQSIMSNANHHHLNNHFHYMHLDVYLENFTYMQMYIHNHNLNTVDGETLTSMRLYHQHSCHQQKSG